MKDTLYAPFFVIYLRPNALSLLNARVDSKSHGVSLAASFVRPSVPLNQRFLCLTDTTAQSLVNGSATRLGLLRGTPLYSATTGLRSAGDSLLLWQSMNVAQNSAARVLTFSTQRGAKGRMQRLLIVRNMGISPTATRVVSNYVSRSRTLSIK